MSDLNSFPCFNFLMNQTFFLVLGGMLSFVAVLTIVLLLRKRKGTILIEFTQTEPFLLGEKINSSVVIKPSKDLSVDKVKIKIQAYSYLSKRGQGGIYHHYDHEQVIQAPDLLKAGFDCRLPFEVSLPERVEIAIPFTDEHVIWILKATAVVKGIDLESERQFLVTKKGHPKVP